MTTSNMLRPSLGSDIEQVPYDLFTMSGDALRDYDHRLHRMGTKSRPLVMDEVQVHPDSLAVEYAIIKPAEDALDFIAAIDTAHRTAERMIGTKLVGVDYVDIAEIVSLTPEATPFLWENARVFGCSPDWEVMERTGKARLRDRVPAYIKTRSLKELGTHFHFTLPEHMRPPEVELADGTVVYDGRPLANVISALHERTAWLYKWDHPTEKPWYRKPRVFRPKSYGFEYRSFGGSLASDRGALERMSMIAFEFMEDCFSGRVSL